MLKSKVVFAISSVIISGWSASWTHVLRYEDVSQMQYDQTKFFRFLDQK